MTLQENVSHVGTRYSLKEAFNNNDKWSQSTYELSQLPRADLWNICWTSFVLFSPEVVKMKPLVQNQSHHHHHLDQTSYFRSSPSNRKLNLIQKYFCQIFFWNCKPEVVVLFLVPRRLPESSSSGTLSRFSWSSSSDIMGTGIVECDEEMQNLKLVKHNQCRSAVQSFFISNFSYIHVVRSCSVVVCGDKIFVKRVSYQHNSVTFNIILWQSINWVVRQRFIVSLKSLLQLRKQNILKTKTREKGHTTTLKVDHLDICSLSPETSLSTTFFLIQTPAPLESKSSWDWDLNVPNLWFGCSCSVLFSGSVWLLFIGGSNEIFSEYLMLCDAGITMIFSQNTKQCKIIFFQRVERVEPAVIITWKYHLWS